MGLIFVGGIHGAGKTTLCEQLAPLLTAQHFSAGELIRRSLGRTRTVDKSVVDVGENQRRLVQAVEELFESYSMILLDGHYCVINHNGEIEPVPVEVFRALAPSALLCLSADPLQVATRLEQRDKKYYDSAMLARYNECEEAHARHVSGELRVPLAVLHTEFPVEEAKGFLLGA